MKYLLKFNEDVEYGKGIHAKSEFFTNKLKDGFAICVLRKDIPKFLYILKVMGWIELPDSDSIKHYTDDKYYFILIGQRLLHTNKPYFGGHEFDVYTPNGF